jgi:hypothetical protein
MRSELNLCEKARGQSKPRQKWSIIWINTRTVRRNQDIIHGSYWSVCGQFQLIPYNQFTSSASKVVHLYSSVYVAAWSVLAHSVQLINVFCFPEGPYIQFSVRGGCDPLLLTSTHDSIRCRAIYRVATCCHAMS